MTSVSPSCFKGKAREGPSLLTAGLGIGDRGREDGGECTELLWFLRSKQLSSP